MKLAIAGLCAAFVIPLSIGLVTKPPEKSPEPAPPVAEANVSAEVTPTKAAVKGRGSVRVKPRASTTSVSVVNISSSPGCPCNTEPLVAADIDVIVQAP